MSSPPVMTKRFWLAAAIPIPIAVASIALCVSLLGQYGLTVFLLIPFAIGITSVLLYKPVSGHDFVVVVVTVLISYLGIGLVVAALQLEGLVCMAMAVPL